MEIKNAKYQKQYDDCFNTPNCDVATIEADTTKSEKWQTA